MKIISKTSNRGKTVTLQKFIKDEKTMYAIFVIDNMGHLIYEEYLPDTPEYVKENLDVIKKVYLNNNI